MSLTYSYCQIECFAIVKPYQEITIFFSIVWKREKGLSFPGIIVIWPLLNSLLAKFVSFAISSLQLSPQKISYALPQLMKHPDYTQLYVFVVFSFNSSSFVERHLHSLFHTIVKMFAQKIFEGQEEKLTANFLFICRHQRNYE